MNHDSSSELAGGSARRRQRRAAAARRFAEAPHHAALDDVELLASLAAAATAAREAREHQARGSGSWSAAAADSPYGSSPSEAFVAPSSAAPGPSSPAASQRLKPAEPAEPATEHLPVIETSEPPTEHLPVLGDQSGGETAEPPTEALVAVEPSDSEETAGSGRWFLEGTIEPTDDDPQRTATGFAAKLASHGVPQGYLPAQDLFSAKEADLEGSRRRRGKRRLRLIAVLAVVALILGGGVWWVAKTFTAPPADFPGPGTQAVAFQVKAGWGSRQIASHLAEEGIVKSKEAFAKALEDSGKSGAVFHPGAYEMRKEMSAAQAVEVLTKANAAKWYVPLDGSKRLPAALQVIHDGTGLDLAELTTLANKPTEFGLPASRKNLEGYLHPGEYRFDQGSTAKEVLKAMVDATLKQLTDAGVTKADKQYEILKIASVVAGEAPRQDYAHVAGIIDNRLKPGNTETHGLLQLDSTVAYGLNRVSLQISNAEKKDASNPYNSYVHKGLPPSPILSPSKEAIDAALKPQASGDYYWVTVNPLTGETKYSSTYQQHQQYVNEYRAWCKANEGKCA